MNYILCPTRNNLHLLRKAYASFEAQDIPVVPLIIDNATTDGTAQFLASTDALTIRNEPSRLVSASWNQGLRWLFGEEKVEHVLVVNNDVELRPETYRLLLADGGQFVTAVSSDERFKREAESDKPGAARRDHPDFSCFLIRKSVWDTVGQFEEATAIYCQDGDYHLRMVKAGIRAYCINLSFYHLGSATIKQADNKERQNIAAQAALDRAAFERKWGVAMGSPEYYALFPPQVRLNESELEE